MCYVQIAVENMRKKREQEKKEQELKDVEARLARARRKRQLNEKLKVTTATMSCFFLGKGGGEGRCIAEHVMVCSGANYVTVSGPT